MGRRLGAAWGAWRRLGLAWARSAQVSAGSPLLRIARQFCFPVRPFIRRRSGLPLHYLPLPAPGTTVSGSARRRRRPPAFAAAARRRWLRLSLLIAFANFQRRWAGIAAGGRWGWGWAAHYVDSCLAGLRDLFAFRPLSLQFAAAIRSPLILHFPLLLFAIFHFPFYFQFHSGPGLPLPINSFFNFRQLRCVYSYNVIPFPVRLRQAVYWPPSGFCHFIILFYSHKAIPGLLFRRALIY